MGGIAATNFISNAGLPNMLLAAFIPGFRWLLPPDFYLAVAPATQIFATSPVAVRAERNASVKSTDAFKRTFAISLFASLIASGQASAQSPADDFSRRQEQQEQLQRLENLKQVTPGSVTTAEEIASLTESVVVYEWQTVNGTTVLAPVLHLAANDRERLNSAGALIAGNQVTIDTGLLATSGMVASTGDLSVSGSSIAAIGGTFTAGGNASLKGNESILLPNAKVTAGGNLGLTSNGDINISVTERSTTSTLRDKRSFTTVVRTTSQGSEITAGGSVSANAGGNLNVIGSNIAADGTVGLKATGDVTIAEAIDTTTIDYTYRKKGGLFGGSKQTTSHTETQTVVGSSVSSGKGVSIISGGDTVVSASKVTAGDETDKADINVSAGGDLLIASGKNTAEFEQSSSSRAFSRKRARRSTTTTKPQSAPSFPHPATSSWMLAATLSSPART